MSDNKPENLHHLYHNDRVFVDNLSEIIGFPNNEHGVKLFGKYRDILYPSCRKRYKKLFYKLMTDLDEQAENMVTKGLCKNKAEATIFLLKEWVAESLITFGAYQDASLSFIIQNLKEEIKKLRGKQPSLRLVK